MKNITLIGSCAVLVGLLGVCSCAMGSSVPGASLLAQWSNPDPPPSPPEGPNPPPPPPPERRV